MALGDSYITLAELKAYMAITTSSHDTSLTDALTSASREIERYTRRQFNDAGSATARVYHAQDCGLALVDDFSTTSGLIVETDDGDDGTYEQLWNAADYITEPLNGVRAGVPGWPYWKIRAVESLYFPEPFRRPGVRVTARWGWAAVPAPIKQACKILAAKNFQLKDAPMGVAGFGEFGVVRVTNDATATGKLAPYRRDAVLVQ